MAKVLRAGTATARAAEARAKRINIFDLFAREGMGAEERETRKASYL